MEEYIFHEILCLQKFTKNISYTLKAKNDSNRQVLVQDLKSMFVAQHKIQVDTARWLTHKLYFIKNDKHTISLGMLILFIIEKLELNLEAKDPEHCILFKELDYLTA